MKKNLIFRSIILIAIGIISCSEDDLNKLNPNEVVVESFFKNEAELESTVYSVYSTFQRIWLWGNQYFFMADMRGDGNASGGAQLAVSANQILTGVHNPGNSMLSEVWTDFYLLIHRANTVLDNAPTTTEISDSARNLFIAEAKFARGLSYAELGFFWGGVPIYTTVANSADGSNPRSTREETFAQAISDLTEAALVLPTKSELEQPGRFTKGAANAVLARIYMFQGEYASAKAVLDDIVDSNQYALVDEYDDNFQEENEFNQESLFEVVFSEIGSVNWSESGGGNSVGNERAIRTQQYSAIGWRNIIPSERLLSEFETIEKGDSKRDPRLEKSFYFIGDSYNNGANVLQDEQVQGNTILFEGEQQKISWRKFSSMYKMNSGYYEGGINHRVIRYAEVLLNLAECELELGSPQRAIDLLNQVRARPSVDMPPYPTSNYPVNNNEAIMDAIMHEKMVELSSEQIRYRDILRWRQEGKLATEPFSYFVPNKYELMPIPQAEIDNNPNIDEGDQNPGY